MRSCSCFCVKTVLLNKNKFSSNFSHYLLVYETAPRKNVFSLTVSMYSRGLNVKHFYNGVVQVQDHFRYGFVEIDMKTKGGLDS